ncbi:MAG: hypothetical protein HDT25_08160 [Ruminococcus sp.]|nr:hypothetical protein [Ruminococcus sp.]
MIDQELIKRLSRNLNEILEDELKAGNEIHETFYGKFSECTDDHLFIWLKYPFKTAIRNDLEGIIYRPVDDPHYWKAEYADINNNQILACNFDKKRFYY